MPTATKAIIGSALLLLSAAAAQAQTTYTYTGTSDNNPASQWNVTTNWDTDPNRPGTGFEGAIDDIVIIRNQLTVEQEVRLVSDAGTIGDITVGGQVNGTGADTELQLRGGGSLVVAGLMQIGDTFAATDGGRIEQVDNPNVSTLTLNDVVSGSTDGNNRLLTNSIGAILNIGGDIDTAAVRSGLDGLDAYLIDLQINRGTLNLTGGPQTLNVQDFNLGESNANDATATATVGVDQTIDTSAQADVARNLATTQSNREMTATLNVHGGTMNVGADLVLASLTGGGTASNNNTSTGTISVGDLSNPGILNVGDELRLAPKAEPDGTTSATLIVTNTSTVNVANGIEFASQQNQPGASATITIDGGTMTVSGPIEDHEAGGDLTTNPNNSTLVVNGGELVLLDAGGLVRGVDTLTHSGGTIDFLAYGGMPGISCTDADLAAGTGSTVYDITNASDAISSTTELATWDNGGGDSDWDTGSNWSNDVVPSEGAGIVITGTMLPLVSSTNAITAGGGVSNLDEAAIGNSDGGWTLAQTANAITITRTGAGFGSGLAKAVIDTAVTVNRGSDLNVQDSGGQGADASELDLSAGTLAVTGNLILGGAGAQGTINQTGGAVTVSADLLFGGTGGTQGGIYNLDAGTLTVTGDIIEGASGAPNEAVDTAQLHIDGGTLVVTGGDITTQRFAVGEKTGTTGLHTLSAGQTITTTGEFTIGELGNGTFTATDATITIGTSFYNADQAGSIGTMTLNGSTSVSATSSVLEVAGGGTGEMTLNGSSSLLNSGGDFRVADIGTGTLNMNGSSTITHSGGNFEVAETASSNGTLNMNTTGTLFINSNNLIIGQSPGSTAAVNLDNGTIDLQASTNNGHLNVNGGVATVTMTGGAILVGDDCNLSNNAISSLRWTQSGGSLLIDDRLDYRNNGDDQIELSGNAIVRTGQLAGQSGTFFISSSSSVLGTGNNVLTLKGSGVTFEIAGTAASLTADTDSTINWEFDATSVSPIIVGSTGTVTLNGAFANFSVAAATTPPSTGTHTLIDNQGALAVVGEFDSLVEGAVVDVSDQLYQISYIGGDGNDVVLAPLADPVVSITAAGDVVEGTDAVWTVTALPAPSGSNVTVNIVYGGTVDGSDFTAVTPVTILDGDTTAALDVPTIDDGIFEGCEVIIASIDSVSGAGASVGAPASAQLTIFDGNSLPTATELEQVAVGTGTVDFADIVVTDPDASYDSKVSTSALALFQYSGIGNVSSFSDGRPNDDGSFTLNAGYPSLSEAAGMSIDVDFIPQTADLTGTAMVFEIGGASNGSSILLVDGYPHLLSKANGNGGNAPTDDESVANVFTDLDWDPDNTIVVPLSTTKLSAGLPARIAVVYDILGDTVTISVNGEAEGSATLIGRDGTNWRGDHTVNLGKVNGGVGGENTVAGSPFLNTGIKSLAGEFGAVSCVRFWNESTGSTAATEGTAETVTATLTIAGWASATDGVLTGLTDQGGGVFDVSGDVPTVNAALAAAQFVETTATYPVTIAVSITDGGTPTTGTIYIVTAQPEPVYVSPGFGTNFLDPITDVDFGTPGDQPGEFGVNAFSTLADALVAVDPAGTIIVNDGDYGTEEIALLNSETLQLANTVGGVTIGSLNAASTNSIDLQGNGLTLGNDTAQNTIDCVISGTGTLTKVGTDRLIMRAPNTYTGTTSVSVGQLRVGSNAGPPLLIGSLAGPVVVDLGAVLEFNPVVDTTITHSTLISGGGLVVMLQDGTVVFDGPPNTFTGGIQLGDSGASSWNGTAGSKNGFVVIGHNNHLGDPGVPIDWRGHQLQASTTGLIVPNDIVVGNGGFRFGGSNNIEMSGDVLNFDTSRGIGNYGPDDGTTITLSGTINLQDAAAATVNLTVDGTNGTDNRGIVFSGPVTGPGNIILGGTFDNGTVTLTDLTSDYAGTTTIAAGTLFQNGTHSGGGIYTVNSGGVLGGSGSTTSAVTVSAGGTLAPGTSVGTLSTGGLTLAGSLEIEVTGVTTPGTDYDQLVVTGTVDLTGGDLVLVGATTLPAGTLSIIDNDDGGDAVTGEFAGLPEGVVDSLASGWSGSITYAGGPVFANDVEIGLSSYTEFGEWRLGFFGNPANTSPGANTDDPEGDLLDNLLEFGFGTDPTVRDNAPLSWDGINDAVPGTPVADVSYPGGGGVDVMARFMRRKDFDDPGSVHYTLEFSSDLTDWETSDDVPTPAWVEEPDVLAEDASGDYELVEVPYPLFIGESKKARFFRVTVTPL